MYACMNIHVYICVGEAGDVIVPECGCECTDSSLYSHKPAGHLHQLHHPPGGHQRGVISQ